MSANIKIISIGIVFLSLICCSSSPPSKDETQELLDEYDRIIEQQKKIIENALANLRKECSDLREYKKFLVDNWQKYKHEEADLLIQLNERQLEFYSEWYDSLTGDNQSKKALYTQKLMNSLDEKQTVLLRNLYIRRREHDIWVTDFQKKSNDFENRKNLLMNYFKFTFSDDPQMYEIIKLRIERDLTY